MCSKALGTGAAEPSWPTHGEDEWDGGAAAIPFGPALSPSELSAYCERYFA